MVMGRNSGVRACVRQQGADAFAGQGVTAERGQHKAFRGGAVIPGAIALVIDLLKFTGACQGAGQGLRFVNDGRVAAGHGLGQVVVGAGVAVDRLVSLGLLVFHDLQQEIAVIRVVFQ